MSQRKARMRQLAEQMRQEGNWGVEDVRFSFKDGRWSNGSLEIDDEGLGGSQWIADPAHLLKGFRTYDERTKRFRHALLDAFGDAVVERDALGDLDPAAWPVPKGGKERRDPWRPTYVLALFRPADPVEPVAYCAEASGIDVVANLLDAFTVREDEKCPLVRLGSRGPSKSGFYSPTMTVIEWVARPEKAKVLKAPPLPRPVAAQPKQMSWYDLDTSS